MMRQENKWKQTDKEEADFKERRWAQVHDDNDDDDDDAVASLGEGGRLPRVIDREFELYYFFILKI